MLFPTRGSWEYHGSIMGGSWEDHGLPRPVIYVGLNVQHKMDLSARLLINQAPAAPVWRPHSGPDWGRTHLYRTLGYVATGNVATLIIPFMHTYTFYSKYNVFCFLTSGLSVVVADFYPV
jgi:hypothetical protein